jgi:cystinosin
MTIICLLIWTLDSESLSSRHHHFFQWIDLITVLSTIKVWISFAKYLPQAILNWRRKSTVGWSIQNIILDFTGGVLSL